MNSPSNRHEAGAVLGAGEIPLCSPNVGGNEWDYVRRCLDSGWLSSAGAFVGQFERDFATRVGAPQAVATASGTAALHIALLLAGVGPGDEVVMPSLTFIAPANAVRYAGGWPVFLDVDPEYAQLDPNGLRVFFNEDCRWEHGVLRNRHTGRRIRAILAVDLLGHPADHYALDTIAAEYGLPIVEDATESLGARHLGRSLGSWGRLTAFSFNGNKLLTTGGGGMLTTTEAEHAVRARYLTTQAKDDPIEFIHHTVGFNYRLTNLQAAVGCAQLERLDEFLAAKRRIANVYGEALCALPGVRVMAEAPWAESSWWLYTIRIDSDQARMTSRELMRMLEEDGIQSRPLWQPLHLSPAHHGAFHSACPQAERWQREGLSLPCSTHLTKNQQSRVVARLTALLSRPGR